jgi:hypothetical protein
MIILFDQDGPLANETVRLFEVFKERFPKDAAIHFIKKPPDLSPVAGYMSTNLKGIRTTVFTFFPPIEPGRKRIRGKTSRTA